MRLERSTLPEAIWALAVATESLLSRMPVRVLIRLSRIAASALSKSPTSSLLLALRLRVRSPRATASARPTASFSGITMPRATLHDNSTASKMATPVPEAMRKNPVVNVWLLSSASALARSSLCLTS
ncbi:Uncharacterised protein [Mycobacterium tuberculosis]|nr:Uncharacterised protein [Mycobacterium tuberculosis]